MRNQPRMCGLVAVKKCSVLPLFTLLFPPKPWQPLILLLSPQFNLFQNVRVIGIAQYVAYSDWLPSLNDMHLSSLCVLSWLASSFHFMLNNSPLVVDKMGEKKGSFHFTIMLMSPRNKLLDQFWFLYYFCNEYNFFKNFFSCDRVHHHPYSQLSCWTFFIFQTLFSFY